MTTGLLALLALALGVLYFLYRRWRAARVAPVVWEERAAVYSLSRQRNCRVVVPVSDLASLPALLEPAVAAVRREGGKLILLHVITCPDPLPLVAGDEHMAQARTVLRAALRQAEMAIVPVEGVVRLARHAHEAIIQTVRDKQAFLLVIEEGAQPHDRGAPPASLPAYHLDSLIAAVKAEVVVVPRQNPVAAVVAADRTLERVS